VCTSLRGRDTVTPSKRGGGVEGGAGGGGEGDEGGGGEGGTKWVP
jgi:hypothetical protein